MKSPLGDPLYGTQKGLFIPQGEKQVPGVALPQVSGGEHQYYPQAKPAYFDTLGKGKGLGWPALFVLKTWQKFSVCRKPPCFQKPSNRTGTHTAL